jgi:hypothetical protein
MRSIYYYLLQHLRLPDLVINILQAQLLEEFSPSKYETSF